MANHFYKEEDMQVTNFRFSKQIQTAQYEPELLEAHVLLDEGEDFLSSVENIRSQITVALGRKAGKIVADAAVAEPKKKAPAKKTAAPKPEAPVEVEAAPEKPKAKAPRKTKPIAYNREVKAHQTELAKILNANFDGWKKDDDIRARAKEASIQLTGTDFTDKEGNVLESFTAAVLEAMDDGL